jgi:transposase-like protein
MRCPKCGSNVIYGYGKSGTGDKRFQCVICGFQFVEKPRRARLFDHPRCPVCGNPMYRYMKVGDLIRYRCSMYPVCKTYTRRTKGEIIHGLLPASRSRKIESKNALH